MTPSAQERAERLIGDYPPFSPHHAKAATDAIAAALEAAYEEGRRSGILERMRDEKTPTQQGS